MLRQTLSSHPPLLSGAGSIGMIISGFSHGCMRFSPDPSPFTLPVVFVVIAARMMTNQLLVHFCENPAYHSVRPGIVL